MKICPKCHTVAKLPDQMFCMQCGSSLSDDPSQAAPTSGTTPPVPPAPQRPAAPAAQKAPATAPTATAPAAPKTAARHRSSPLLIPLLVLAVVIVLLLSAILYLLVHGGLPGTTGAGSSSAATSLAGAVASDTQVVLHNARENATITVDGTPVDFQLVGTDAVIPRSSLPDVCQVRLIADLGWGKYQTAAVWYNKDYGNELSFGQDYGEYVDCDADGLAQPGDKMVDVLTWAFYRGFLSAINDQNPGNLSYSTAANTQTCTEEITSYAADTFVLNDFQAVAEPGSIRYSDGVVIYNGHFISHRQSRADGSTSDIDHYRTLRLVWEDGCWKVDAFVLFPEGKYDSSSYAPLN